MSLSLKGLAYIEAVRRDAHYLLSLFNLTIEPPAEAKQNNKAISYINRQNDVILC